MSAQRRAGPVRQLSLQPPQSATRRPPLRKQSSEDIWDSGSNGLRILANAIQSPKTNGLKSSGQVSGRPRPVKLAWTDRIDTPSPGPEPRDVQVEVVARRCKGLPRPSIAKPPTQEQLNLNRQRLAERLRLAWQQRHPTKPNLDIFLAQNTVRGRPNSAVESSAVRKEVTLVLGETCDVDKTDAEENLCGSSAKTAEESSSSSGESNGEDSEGSDQELGGMGEVNRVEACIGREKIVSVRKTGASVNRNTNNSRPNQEGHSPPPPRRLMSAPPIRPRTATPQPIEKLQPQRRRLKTVRRRVHRPDEDISSGDDLESKPRRSRSARTSEVVTMVSLLSPGHSEQEDEDGPTLQPLISSSVHSLNWEEKLQQSIQSGSNYTTIAANSSTAVHNYAPNTNMAAPAFVCIRKPIKSVSFQHGSLNQSRSYANNFPLRRGAATIPDDPSNSPPITPLMPALKRKLFSKMKSNTVIGNEPVVNEIVNTSISLSKCIQSSSTADSDNCTIQQTPPQSASSDISTPLVDNEEIANNEIDAKPDFKSPKEQECWDLFRRMVDKGIAVSFETVLRGMLTPTEYRLRKHDLLSS